MGAAREPHLRFQATDSRVAGSTGCNSLSGTFERHGDHLTLYAQDRPVARFTGVSFQ